MNRVKHYAAICSCGWALGTSHAVCPSHRMQHLTFSKTDQPSTCRYCHMDSCSSTNAIWDPSSLRWHPPSGLKPKLKLRFSDKHLQEAQSSSFILFKEQLLMAAGCQQGKAVSIFLLDTKTKYKCLQHKPLLHSLSPASHSASLEESNSHMN